MSIFTCSYIKFKLFSLPDLLSEKNIISYKVNNFISFYTTIISNFKHVIHLYYICMYFECMKFKIPILYGVFIQVQSLAPISQRKSYL